MSISAKFFLFFWIFSCCIISRDLAQTTYERKGYLICIQSELIFQPCEDSSITLLQSLTDSSFSVTIIGNDGYPNFYPLLKGLGRKTRIEYRNNTQGKEYEDWIYYLYCKVNLDLDLSPDNPLGTKKIDCVYSIRSNDSYKNLGCYFVWNALREVEPYYISDRNIYVDRYFQYNKAMPEWW